MKITPQIEQQIIQNYQNNISLKKIAKDNKISQKTVYQILKNKNITATRIIVFTEKEIQFLKDNYIKLGPTKCGEILNKKPRALTEKAAKLKLTKSSIKWTNKEIEWLKNNYLKISKKECANILKKTKGAIQVKASKLKLTIPKNFKKWTEEEINFIKNNYQQNGSTYCIKFLNRTRSQIYAIAQKLNLRDKTRNHCWTKEEENFIIENYPTKGAKFCSKNLHLRMAQIHAKASVLDIKNDWTGKYNRRWNGYEEISGSFWCQIKHGAKRRDIKFNITIEQAWNQLIKQNKKCALSGIELKFKKQGNDRNDNASLDRIDSEKDYTIDNIQWVHKDLNCMKQDLSDGNFINWCKMVADYQNKKILTTLSIPLDNQVLYQ